MIEMDDCKHCGQSYFLHIEILDMHGQLHRLCPNSIYEEINKIKYLTKREREEYEKK